VLLTYKNRIYKAMKLSSKIITFMAITAGTSSAATTIGFNFTETWWAKQVEGDTVYGSDQWTDSVSHSATNGTVAANSTDPDAVTTTTAIGVTVAWSSSNMYQAGDENGIVENKLFRRYLDDGGDGPTITVNRPRCMAFLRRRYRLQNHILSKLRHG